MAPFRDRESAVLIAGWLDELDARGIPITREMAVAISAQLDHLLQASNVRVRIKALDLAGRFLKYNLDRAVVAEKKRALDGGEPTERVEMFVTMDADG